MRLREAEPLAPGHRAGGQQNQSFRFPVWSPWFFHCPCSVGPLVLSPGEAGETAGEQEAVGLCQSQLLPWLCLRLAPSSCPSVSAFPAHSQQPCLPPGWRAGFVSQGPPLFIVRRPGWGWGGILPTLGEGLLGWAGDKALQSGESFGVGATELD